VFDDRNRRTLTAEWDSLWGGLLRHAPSFLSSEREESSPRSDYHRSSSHLTLNWTDPEGAMVIMRKRERRA
jgi:hypothetical protein